MSLFGSMMTGLWTESEIAVFWNQKSVFWKRNSVEIAVIFSISSERLVSIKLEAIKNYKLIKQPVHFHLYLSLICDGLMCYTLYKNQICILVQQGTQNQKRNQLLKLTPFTCPLISFQHHTLPINQILSGATGPHLPNPYPQIHRKNCFYVRFLREHMINYFSKLVKETHGRDRPQTARGSIDHRRKELIVRAIRTGNLGGGGAHGITGQDAGCY